MPLFVFARIFTSLLSLVILGAGGYLLWSWYQGDWLRDATGDLYRLREDWRLWAGLGLLAWSFAGRWITPLLLARGGGRRSSSRHGEGRSIRSPTGNTLYVESHGSVGAPPVILTHGWGMDSTFWSYAREDLAGRFRLILWDLPGLGRSRPAAPGGVTLKAFADDLTQLIDQCGAHRPVLVGHSIGGMTIQTLIRDNPQIQDRLAGVALLNTTYTNPLKTMILPGLMRALQKPVLEPLMKLHIALNPLVWAMAWQSYLSGSSHIAQRLGYGRYVTRSQLEHTTLLSTRNPPSVQARGTLAMFDWDASEAAGRLRIPALVIGGDKDIVTKLEANRAIAAGAREGRLEVVEGVNHMGPMERADLYDRLIADFVLSVQPAASDRASADGVRPGQGRRPSEGRGFSASP